MQRQFIAVPVGAQVQLDVTHLSQRNLMLPRAFCRIELFRSGSRIQSEPSTITFELKEEAYSAAGLQPRTL